MTKTIPNEPKPGDPLLYYGVFLEVKSVEDANGHRLVNAFEQGAFERRAGATLAIKQMREEQLTATDEQHAALADAIKKLSREEAHLIFNVGLRLDYVSWWPERKCWTADGRVLSEWQNLAANMLLDAPHGKPRPEAQRMFYDLCQNLSPEQIAVVDAKAKLLASQARARLIAEHEANLAALKGA